MINSLFISRTDFRSLYSTTVEMLSNTSNPHIRNKTVLLTIKEVVLIQGQVATSLEGGKKESIRILLELNDLHGVSGR